MTLDSVNILAELSLRKKILQAIARHSLPPSLIPYCPQSFYRHYHAMLNPIEFAIYTQQRTKPKLNETQSIFIHIPKTAGMAIAQSLYGSWIEGVHPCAEMGHASLAKYQWILAPREFKRYFKFSFVRNPWDRVFSAYCYLKQGGFNEQDQAWSKKNIGSLDFEAFVTQQLQHNSNILRGPHFIPQHCFLQSYNKKNYPLDFLGMFENLPEDFAVVKNKINPSASLLEINKGKRVADYRDCYTPHMVDIVAKCYADDILLLAYTFENDSIQSQINKKQKNQLLIQKS